jgi:hypothetical protein
MTMDELTLVAQLRDDYPAGIDLAEAQRLLAAEISGASVMIPERFGHIAHQTLRDHEVRGRTAGSGRRFGAKLVVAGAVAAAAAAATVIALQNVPAHPADRPGASPRTSLDASGLLLANYAAKAAASAPAWQPDEWIYSDVLRPAALPKPGAQNPTITWTQVDWHQFAYYQNGKLVTRNDVPYLGQTTSTFARPVSEGDLYSYLQSLPTTPAALRAVIVHNLETYPNGPRTGPLAVGTGNYGVWFAIQTTVNGTVLPPKLLAAVYGVLATDPAVHFDTSVTDNAGQTGVGFYTIGGSSPAFKDEIMINPSTYAYMGCESVALGSVTRHTTIDGHTFTRVIEKGQVSWTDLVGSGIVQQPGQTP